MQVTKALNQSQSKSTIVMKNTVKYTVANLAP